MLSLNSSTCLGIGYLTLYSFTAFSFWINAMAANIFFKFSSMLSMSSSEASGWKLFLYSVYAQGMPLVLCLVVGLLDRFGSCEITRSVKSTTNLASWDKESPDFRISPALIIPPSFWTKIQNFADGN